MQFLVFAGSVGLIYFIAYSTKKLAIYPIKERFLRLLQFVKFAPILAFLVLLILVLTTFHTKKLVRLSHAWYTAQFWAYTAFLYCSYALTKNKNNLIPMVISLFIVLYITPLFHYEQLITGRYVIVADIFGVLMYVALLLAITKINKGKEAVNEQFTS